MFNLNLLYSLIFRMEKQAEVSTGGYDYQFVETLPDMLICKICHFPSREPCLSECCGHTFCKSCIDHAKNAVFLYPFLCPVCRSDEFKLIRNKQNERVIKSLHVYCTNKERGCEWQGEINDINGHLESIDGCPFEEVTCSNKCDKLLQRKYVNDHLKNECPRRKADCQYCHITDELQFIKGSHIDKCPKFPLSCPNDCGISDIPREDMSDHRKRCPLEEVECPNVECLGSIQRQYLQNHIENECQFRKITCLYCQIVDKQHYIEGLHIKLCPKFPSVCPNKCEAEAILREDMKTHKMECPLEMIQCRYHNVGCKTMLARKDLPQHNQEKMEEHLSFTMSELVSTKDKLASTEQELASTKWQLTTSTDKALSKLQEKIEAIEIQSQMRLQKIIDQVQWGFHINTMASNSCNQILPVIIKVSEFDRKKRNDDDWYSHTFFTHENGYEIKLNVVPAGWDDCKGTHISVCLFIEEGPNDHLLNWPMKKRFEVKLLNQISDSKHHSQAYTISVKRKATKGNDSIWYADKFISYDLFYDPRGDCKFLVNDTVFFEVSEIQLI